MIVRCLVRRACAGAQAGALLVAMSSVLAVEQAMVPPLIAGGTEHGIGLQVEVEGVVLEKDSQRMRDSQTAIRPKVEVPLAVFEGPRGFRDLTRARGRAPEASPDVDDDAPAVNRPAR
jgi:hypothetical protein